MRDRFGIVFLTTVLIALGAAAQPDSTASPSVTILETQEAQSILGRDVRSLTDEDMGRIVDILVDGEGGVRAAIIDFGGFLGVGSRKIAVDWRLLRFAPGRPDWQVLLTLGRAEIQAAPEYKPDATAHEMVGPPGEAPPSTATQE